MDHARNRLRRFSAPTALLAFLTFTACAAPVSPGPTQPPSDGTSEPTAHEGPQSISAAFTHFGCTGIVEDASAPIEREARCKVGEGELAYFWEFADAQTAQQWLRLGDLELSPTDAVYVSGPLVMMARDTATAQAFSEVASPAP